MSNALSSSSSNPDLDWSQLKETLLMLNLSVAQIDQSLKEGNSSVDTLASSFTALANNLNDIQSSVMQIKTEGNKDNEEIKAIIKDSSITAFDKVQTAIIAFQFYDKLTQRLDHVSSSLSSLGQLISNPEALYSPPKWQALQESIRSKYSMEEERKMFDKVLSGISIEEALDEFNQEMETKNKADNIELF